MDIAIEAQRSTFRHQVVDNIRHDLPDTLITADPTMSQLAHYARLAGVTVATWMRQ